MAKVGALGLGITSTHVGLRQLTSVTQFRLWRDLDE